MISAVEAYWDGTVHSHSNATFLNLLSSVFPEKSVAIHGSPSHLKHMAFTLQRNVKWKLFEEKLLPYNTPALKRFIFEYFLLHKIIKRMQSINDSFLVSLSTSGPSLRAYCLLQRIYPHLRIIARLHGNLNEINGWRPKHPVRRYLTLAEALAAVPAGNLHLVVLEDSIREALLSKMPSLERQIHAIPEVVSAIESQKFPGKPLSNPSTFTFLGVGTTAKGADLFVEIARQAKNAGLPARFEMYGMLHASLSHLNVSHLDQPPAKQGLERQQFVDGLARADFIIVPYDPVYYTLSASGVLVDAVTALKPIVTLPVAFAESAFRNFGDIGYLCRSVHDLSETVMRLAQKPDPARYDRQVECLRRFRSARTETAISARLRGAVGLPL